MVHDILHILTPPMLQPELSPLLVTGVAESVCRAGDVRQALEAITSELFRTVGTRAVIFERVDGRWTPVAGTDGGRGSLLPPELSFRDRRVVRLGAGAGAFTTALSLSVGAEPDLVLMLDGDWTSAQDALTVWSLVLAHALQTIRERDVTRRSERLLVRGYAMARRLSRVGDVSTVAHRVVAHVAQILKAERVSLALYREQDECLAIAATHGYPLASVEEVRIKSGDWVIGHVYASKRPVFVRDVRLLSAASKNNNQYRTFSFAAVPLVAGSETLGVLTVTDKRDGSAFGRQDEIVLRAIGVWAGTALAAARVETEAARLAYAATIDSLTGLLNRPYLDSRLHQEVERSKREGASLAVLIADIDDFKTINDTWGHQVGDLVLQTVGSVIRSAVRVFDVCARYGGDEFAIVMPNSDRASALACAERMQRRLQENRATETDGNPRLTMSIGAAVITPGDSAADLILRADRCMYQAKADGKNLVRAQASWLDDALMPSAGQPAERSPRPVVVPVADEPIVEEESSRLGDLPYVLVADANQERAAFCHESVSGAGLGLLIARDGEQAIRAIERFGAPLLLIVDLSLPIKDGFAVIEAVRRDERRRSEIVAWAASRDMREYASARLTGQDVHVISDTAPRATMRAVIEHAIAPRDVAPDDAGDATSELDDLRQRMTDLSNRARQLCGTPGVGIYMKVPGDTRYRAAFAWTSDDLMPHSPQHLPRAFERIAQTGESILALDLTDHLAADDSSVDAVRGLAGVPIVAGGEVLGAICVFDIKPLDLDERSFSSLKTLGHVAFDVASVVLPTAPASGFRDRASDRASDGAKSGEASQVRPHAVDWPPSLLERRGGEFAVARELARARREGHQLSVILFDCAPVEQSETGIDEAALEALTDTLLRAIRQSDLPIRWSGSELLVVLPGLADTQARTVAERVRAALHAGARHRMAISGGVAELKADERFGDVVDRARQKVAMARGRGHNRVI